MATYKEIKGVTVQTRDEDPVVGGIAGASWSSGGNVNTARASGGGAGTAQTEALLFGGTGGSNVANTEQYNGTSWTETADLNNARSLMGGTGTYTAALAAGGSSPGQYVESWNGSAWTETTDLNTARRGNNGLFGTQPAAIITGGYLPSGPGTAATEQWNGSSWTEVNDLNTARWALTTGGTTTAGIAAGGEVSPKGQTETWNGSSWTETTDLNTGRGEIGGSGGSSAQTALLVFGGGSSQTKTENFDGSTWTELSDMATYRGQLPKTNIANTGALAISGGTPGSPYNAATEHFDAPSIFSKITEGQLFFNSTTNTFKETITDIPGATWASGGTMNQSKSSQANIGNSKASNTVGGQTPSPAYLTNNEQYDGTSWTEVNDLNTGRQVGSGIGTSAAGLIAGGRPAVSGGAGAQNESWDGTSFTEEADLNTGRGYGRGAGTQTAAINVGGFINPPAVRYANVETWNGSAWTETTDLNAVRSSGGIAQASPYTSTIVFGGDTGPGPSTTSSIATAETWDGSSWTEVSDLNEGRRALGGAGDSISSALAFGGSSVNTEFWNGSSWTEINNLSDARSWGGNSGSTLDALVCGDEPFSGATEEWTVDLANKTITAS